jgi:hypothetical protein
MFAMSVLVRILKLSLWKVKGNEFYILLKNNFIKGDVLMKQVYKCDIDGKVFDKKSDCLKHEFELKGGNQRFINDVKEAINYLEDTTDLQFEVVSAKAEIGWDGNPNTSIMNFVELQDVEIIVYFNGEQRGETYSRGGYDYYTKEKLIEELTDEYVTPYKQKFEGYLSDNNDYYTSGFDLDGVNLDKILRAMYGKKIRLEIIEENN